MDSALPKAGELDWTDEATNEERYFAERRRPEGGFKTIANLAAGAQVCTDVGVDCSSSYEYRILVDGHWGNNPAAAHRSGNPYGSENDVLIVT